MSTLHNTLLGITHERGFQFNQTYTTAPDRTGTNPSSGGITTQSGTAPVYEPTIGPIGGAGSWRCRNGKSTGTTLFRFGSLDTGVLNDGDFSLGMWVRIGGLPSGTYNAENMIEMTNNGAILFGVSSASWTGGANRFTYSLNGSTWYPMSNAAVVVNQWYYLAARRVGNTYSIYLNGTLFETRDFASTRTTTTLTFGHGNTDPGLAADTNWWLSNYYHGTSSQIGPTQISQIWTAGSTSPGVNINRSALPATADALQTLPTVSTEVSPIFNALPATADAVMLPTTIETTANVNFEHSFAIATSLQTLPTVTTTDGNNTQIWTAILVNAEMLPASVLAEINNEFTTTIATADADMGQHDIINGNGFSFGAFEATAAAEFINPAFAGSPDLTWNAQTFNANVEMGEALNATPANYRNLVKKYTPSLFITNPVDVSPNDPAEEGYDFINDGYDDWGDEPGSEFSSTIRPTLAPAPMSAIGNGKAIYAFSTSSDDTIVLNQSAALTQSEYFHTVGNNWTWEYWFYPTSYLSNLSLIDLGFVDFGVRTDADADGLYQGLDRFGNTVNHMSYRAKSGPYINIGGKNVLANTSGQRFTLFQESATFPDADTKNESDALAAANAAPRMYQPNQWNHLVARASWSGTTLSVSFFSNNVFIGTASAVVTQADINGAGGTSGALVLDLRSGTGSNVTQYRYLTQTAIYKNLLSNSAINEHYIHITSSSPNRTIAPAPMDALDAELPYPTFIIQDNNNFPALTADGNCELVHPTVVVSINLNFNAGAILVQANAVEPAFYGDPDVNFAALPATAFTEVPPNIYRLDTTYYSYVQNNISPFRYVTFDLPNSEVDWGTDNDFGAAAPFSYDGTISTAIFGINNNSLISSNSNLTTSGLIMKESEHDDKWGTDVKTWHSSFWIQKDLSDTNSNGLRIVANLNSFLDNQYIILYQYNNKLYLQAYDQTHPVQTFESSVNVNVFDNIKHHIVISSSSNDKIQVYKNKLLVIDATLNPTHVITQNSLTHLPPNDAGSNKPRFSVGALITPYAETYLPAIPTPSIMYIDEVHWAVTSINQTGVNNLYNAMPLKIDIEFFADPALSNLSEIVEPTFGTGVGNIAQIAEATNAELLMPSITADFERIVAALPMEANAEFVYPFSVIADNITNIQVFGDIMIATAEILGAVFVLNVNAQPMLANARMVVQDPYIDPYHLLVIQQSRLPLSTSYYGTWGIGDVDS